MNLILALIIGILFGSSVYLMLHRSFFKLIIGIVIFSYATIFFLFCVGGITKNAPPIFSKDHAPLEAMADPLPQALTLTAIVISIGVQIFVIVLLKKAYQNLHTQDLDELNSADKID